MTAVIAAIATPITAAETDNSGSKLIALTFDDGPGPYTDALLDALKMRGVKATFFVVGTCVENYPEVVKREFEEGHQVANHTWNHNYLNKLEPEEITKVLNDTEDAIDRAVGMDVGTLLLRPPGGNGRNDETVRANVNRPMIIWSVDPQDWKYRDSEHVKNEILAGTKEGSIILVHDIHPTSVEGVLPAIDELLAQGYTFVTVSELFRRKGLELEPGVAYYSVPDDGVDLGEPVPIEYQYDETKLDEHCAAVEIAYVRQSGLLADMKENTFGPNFPITRGEYLSALMNLMRSGRDVSCENVFSDVADDSPYCENIALAASLGIANGSGEGCFYPDAYITREQAVIFIFRTLHALGIDKLTGKSFTVSDRAEFTKKCAEAVRVVVSLGIMSTDENGNFLPDETVSRADCAVILTRMDLLIKNHPLCFWQFKLPAAE